jgi:hypothetical protein
MLVLIWFYILLLQKAEAGDAAAPAATKSDKSARPTPVVAKPVAAAPAPTVLAVKAAANDLEQSRLTEARMREELLRKQKELLELQQKKIELELLQAKTRLEEQQRQMMQDAVSAPVVDPAKAQQVRFYRFIFNQCPVIINVMSNKVDLFEVEVCETYVVSLFIAVAVSLLASTTDECFKSSC